MAIFRRFLPGGRLSVNPLLESIGMPITTGPAHHRQSMTTLAPASPAKFAITADPACCGG